MKIKQTQFPFGTERNWWPWIIASVVILGGGYLILRQRNEILTLKSVIRDQELALKPSSTEAFTSEDGIIGPNPPSIEKKDVSSEKLETTT